MQETIIELLNLRGTNPTVEYLSSIGVEYNPSDAAAAQRRASNALTFRDSGSQPQGQDRLQNHHRLQTGGAASIDDVLSSNSQGGGGGGGGGIYGYYNTSDDDESYYLDSTTVTRASAYEGTLGNSRPVQPGVFFQPRYHRREQSLGFTFSGSPTDIVRFLSCISPKPDEAAPPARKGPFDENILGMILLFIPVEPRSTILQVSCTCRHWRFYSNYAPHWTHFRRASWNQRKLDLPQFIRRVLTKPKIVTRQEYFDEKLKVEEFKRHDKRMSTARHIRWCLAVAIIVAAMAAINFVISCLLGLLRTALRSDETLGITTFWVMAALVTLEVTVVVVPLGGASSPSKLSRMARILAWGLYLLFVSIVLGVISALALSRVQMGNRVLSGPTLDFSYNSTCAAYSSDKYPSFARLPGTLTDLRWRPITMDTTESSLVPWCTSKSDPPMCFNLLFFDHSYTSDVFHNATALALFKDVGTSRALGFDPFARFGAPTVWCSDADRPPVIALTQKLYRSIAATRDLLFPDSVYLDAEARPSKSDTANISYRCSANVNRANVEDVDGSSTVWYSSSTAWMYNYVPLLSNKTQEHSDFVALRHHYFTYAYVCYIIAGVLWLIILISQCLSKSSERALPMLGATTVAAVAVMNPITLLISGALCVGVDDKYFMCTASSGGAMIGGGIGLTACALAVLITW